MDAPETPLALPAPVKANNNVIRARKVFARAHLCTEFRSLAFTHPFMPDRHEYMWAQPDNDDLSSWSLSIVRTEEQAAEGPVTTLLPPFKSGLTFLEAMEEIAIYENGERQRGTVPVDSSADDLGLLHYRRAGEAEGLIFNVRGEPRPTLRGQIIVPDQYPAAVWKNVVQRLEEVSFIPRDIVVPAMRRLMQGVTANALSETADISFKEHYDRISEQSSVADRIQSVVRYHKEFVDNHKKMLMRAETAIEKKDRMDSRDIDFAKEAVWARDGVTKLEWGKSDNAMKWFAHDQEFYARVCEAQYMRLVGYAPLFDSKRREVDGMLLKLADQPPEIREKYEAMTLLMFNDELLPVMPESERMCEVFDEYLAQVECNIKKYTQEGLGSLTKMFNEAVRPREPETNKVSYTITYPKGNQP